MARRGTYLRIVWSFLKLDFFPHREYPYNVETGEIGKPIWKRGIRFRRG